MSERLKMLKEFNFQLTPSNEIKRPFFETIFAFGRSKKKKIAKIEAQ